MKRFLYKIYESDGTFITTWNDVVSEPSFSVEMNGGFSELTIKLARGVFNFGENIDVKYGNQVKVYVFDTESGQNGVCIYSGFISRYEPVIEGRKETIDITVVSWWWELARYLFEGNGSGIDSSIYGNGYSADKTATMTSNSAPSPNVTSASSEYNADYAAWKAFDKITTKSGTNNEWTTATTQTGWLKYDFGSGNAKVIQKYSLIIVPVGFYSSRNDAPKTWTFEGSNDGSTWTVLDTRENEQDWAEGEKRVYEFENDTAYRYFRINVSANNGGTYLRIMEMEMFEGVAFSRNGATSIKYLSQDPSNILKDILDKFTAMGGLLDYDTGTVDLTGTTVSYQFNTAMVQEALQKIVELAPEDWYFRIGADNKVYFKPKSSSVDHKFYIGRNVKYYKQEKRLENIVNYIYFKGKDFFKRYSNTSSEGVYGRYAKKMVDERVTKVATADTMANTILDRMATPEIRITIDVVDSNNTEGKGYDIESIKVGDTCKIFNATTKGENLWDSMMWDVDSWDYDVTNTAGIALQIQKVEYHPDFVRLEISNRQPDIAKRIEDINRNLVDSQTADNQVIPD